MNKVILAEQISAQCGLSKKDVEKVLDSLEEVIIGALKKGEEVTLTGFGTFSARTRSARMGVNPQKPAEKIQIPEVIVPKFKSGKALKDALKAKA
ncbi:MAG: HU family DNA-binding protein [Patescibacteria group bacterium]|jgi:DNA-binding protein HU-beta